MRGSSCDVEIDFLTMTFCVCDIACLMACGLLLAACGTTAASRNTPPSNQRQLEAAACKLISATPAATRFSGSFEVVSVQTSTLLALQETDDASLQATV